MTEYDGNLRSDLVANLATGKNRKSRPPRELTIDFC
jgi:hypothetical protein